MSRVSILWWFAKTLNWNPKFSHKGGKGCNFSQFQLQISRLKWWGELETKHGRHVSLLCAQWSHPWRLCYLPCGCDVLVFHRNYLLFKKTSNRKTCKNLYAPEVFPPICSFSSVSKNKKTETPKDRRLQNVHSESPVSWKDTPNFCKDCGLGS